MQILSQYHISKRDLKIAKHLITYSKKVLQYRKHLMSTQTFFNISSLRTNLILSIKQKNYSNIQHVTDQLDKLLHQNGGDIYPVKMLNDNCEVLLVASLIAIAIRTFFIQTFQIPTNSMYPTYSGVTTKLQQHNHVDQSYIKKLYKKIFHGTTSFSIQSNYSGNLEIPLFVSPPQQTATGLIKFDLQRTRKIFGLFPITERIYKIQIGNKVQEITMPLSYSIDSAFLQKFGKGAASWQELYNTHPENFRLNKNTLLYKPGYSVKCGESLIDFDIISGDVLFVDKFSYHFRAPKIGEAVVFRTEKIKNIPGEPYYFIKRLIGKQHDSIQLRNGILYRNTHLITGSDIFYYENNKMNNYPGYSEAGYLNHESTVYVPKDSYFVLGDNSPDSGDSRFWGFVPKKEIIGRPLLIFYPSNRAGLCR